MARYSDVSISFNLHPMKNDLVVLTDVEAVKRAIKNVIFTNRGERLYNPDFGAGVTGLLFELSYDDMQFVLEERIKSALANFEPRCSLQSTKVVVLPEENAVKITIEFFVINIPTQVTLDILLERIK